ncbi:MAG TPA: VOC family protein [Candidatus Sulfotelmatobacter sp.]|nr:VOC family protein [Candidatus Sulfotelmatobacter sp.]
MNLEAQTETQIETTTETNVKQAVPFFMVSNLEASLRYYVDGLGFRVKRQWIDQGKLRWCWLELGGAALMLQDYLKGRAPADKPGVGVSICFQCVDALKIYRDVKSRGIQAKRPFVGNAMWVTSLTDPDGYKLDFESPTDAPEESELAE